MAENVLKFDLKFLHDFSFPFICSAWRSVRAFYLGCTLDMKIFPLCSITALIPANPSTVANSPSMGARVVLLGVVDLIRDLIETLRVLSNKPKTAVDLNILKIYPSN